MEVQDSVDKMRSEGLIEVSLFGVRYRMIQMNLYEGETYK